MQALSPRQVLGRKGDDRIKVHSLCIGALQQYYSSDHVPRMRAGDINTGHGEKYEYLYEKSSTGQWFKSPATTKIWSWDPTLKAQLSGNYVYGTGYGATGTAFACREDGSSGTVVWIGSFFELLFFVPRVSVPWLTDHLSLPLFSRRCSSTCRRSPGHRWPSSCVCWQ